MQISLREVGGQMLRVGVRRGDNARPPLLLFNGIGANIELVEGNNVRITARAATCTSRPMRRCCRAAA